MEAMEADYLYPNKSNNWMVEFEIAVNDKKSLSLQSDAINDIEIIERGEYFTLKDLESFHGKIKKVSLSTKQVTLEVNGRIYTCAIDEPIDQVLQSLNLNNKNQKIKADLISTMPGLVLSVLVSEDQHVEAGTPLMILEAMKMENVLKAAYAGAIQKICCKPGDAVEKGQLLIEIAP